MLVEVLCDRVAPATFTQSGPVLTVLGTKGRDVLVVEDSEEGVTVTSSTLSPRRDSSRVFLKGGKEASLEVRGFKGVETVSFHGGKGDDFFLSESLVETFVRGGAGSDVLAGGLGPDAFFGSGGNDLLIGDSLDVLEGEAGANVVLLLSVPGDEDAAGEVDLL